MNISSKNFLRRTATVNVEVEPGPPGPQGAQGPAGADGTDGASITWRGPWVSPGESDYLVNQAVSHNGSTYICILDHLNATSLEPGVAIGWQTHWELMASQGAAAEDAPVLIGEILFGDVNALAATPTVNITFAGAKPADKVFRGIIIQTTQGFASVTRGLNLLQPVVTANQPFDAANETAIMPFNFSKAQSDIVVTLSFDGAGVNPQDFTAGEANVYAIFSDFPAL